MGMEYRILTTKPLSWPALADLLRSKNYPVQMRMIDGQLAFPDEEPPENWKELRLGTPGGMIALHRQGDVVKVVTWGNADEKMRAAWNAVAWAAAMLTESAIENEQGSRSPYDFQSQERMPFADAV